MIQFTYYIICKLVEDVDGNFLPEFIHCALKNDKFYKIISLGEYLKTGSSISEELIEYYDSFLKINSKISTLNFNF